MCLLSDKRAGSGVRGGDGDGIRNLVAAHALGAADHNWSVVPGARHAVVFRVSEPRAGPHSVARCPRLARAGWRRSHSDRPIHPTSGLHSRRRYGRRLLLCARAERLLSSAQRGQAGDSLLFRLPLPFHGWRRRVERRPATGVFALPVNAQAEARRRSSIRAFIAGGGQSSSSQPGSGSGPLTVSASSWSSRPSGKSSSA